MIGLFTLIFFWWLTGALGLATILWIQQFEDNPETITIRHIVVGFGYAFFGLIVWAIVGMYLEAKINYKPLKGWVKGILDIQLNGRPEKVKAEKPVNQRVEKTKAEPSEKDVLKSNLLDN